MSAPTEALLLGVDGGASGVRVHVVERLATGRLRLGGRSAEQSWEGWAGFAPVEIERQLSEREGLEAGRVAVDEAERSEGHAWVHTLANAVAELTFGLELHGGLRLGVCLPGLKSSDGRGVLVARNGPRIPDFAAELERQLAGRNIPLAATLPPLASDGEASGWGEEHAPQGKMGGVPSAYYLACGTGVAEALKLEGRHLPLDEVRAHLPAPWAIRTERGTMEDRLSLRELARALGGHPDEPIEALAHRADRAGRAALGGWASALGAFLGRRVLEIEAAGVQLDRIVVGQRSGRLLADEHLAECVRNPLHRALETAMRAGQDGGVLVSSYASDLVVASTLRAAPAIGAAAAALGLVSARRGEPGDDGA